MKQVLRLMCVSACVLGAGLVGGCGGDAESPDAAPSASASASAKKPSFNADAVKGALIFKKTCATCHGGDAKGLPNNGKDLTASAFVKETSEVDLLAYVIKGREVPGGVSMPPRGGFTEEILPDGDIEKVIVYLKNFKGNKP